MKNLINADWSINIHEEFAINKSGKRLRVVGTEDLYKSEPQNVIDTIKNLDTGKLTEMTREKLKTYKPVILDDKIKRLPREDSERGILKTNNEQHSISFNGS